MPKPIRLSEKHGVNPSLEQCYVCLQDVGLILMGLLPDDKQAPRRMCLDQEPCPGCKDWMTKGVVLISVDAAKSPDKANPWRTGGWVVVKDDFIQRVFQPEDLVANVLKHRMAFVPDDAWDHLGLPRGDSNEIPAPDRS